MTKFHIKEASWADHNTDLKHLRDTVFVQEQRVPIELEWDGLDANARHVIALNEHNQAVGCLRFLPSHQMGRMAVLPAFRQQGCGTALVAFFLASLSPKQKQHLFLHAQIQAKGFYQRFGFIQQGDVFDDAGIQHVEMVLAASN